MKNNLTRITSRLYNTPHLINGSSLENILHVLEPRLKSGAFDLKNGNLFQAEEKDDYEAPAGIAVIQVYGSLVRKASMMEAECGLCSYDSISKQLSDALADSTIKGIMLDIDSPGGEASGCFDLADEIYQARQSKPVWACANEEAFSAAYAIASSAQKIYIPRTGGAGSVGVVAAHIDQSERDKQIGLKWTFIHAGDRKVDGNPHEPIKDEALNSIQSEVDRLYGLFVDTVARNRNMSSDEVRGTEAGLYFGENAVSAKLADKVGTMKDALLDMSAFLQSNVNNQNPITLKNNTKGIKMENENQEVEAVEADAVEEKVEEIQATVSEKFSYDMDQISEITELCEIANKKDLAIDFMKKQMSVADVRKALLNQKASSASADEISSIVPVASIESKPVSNLTAAQIFEMRKNQIKNKG